MKYAKLENGVLTFAPKNKGSIINYNLNTEQMLKDGYKPFVEAEKENGKAYEYSYEETDAEIREIVSEIIADEAEIIEYEKNLHKEKLYHELENLDLKSIRGLRAVVAGTSINADIQKLEEIEAEVQKIRSEIYELNMP